MTTIDRTLLPGAGVISLGLLIHSVRKEANNHSDRYRTKLKMLQANPEAVQEFRNALDEGGGFKVNFVRRLRRAFV